MLQCQIWGRDTGNAGEWEALTGTQGRKKKYVVPYLLRVSARFSLSGLRANYMTLTKFKWGQSVAWLIFGIFFPPGIGALFPTVPSDSVHDPQLTPELRPNKQID